MTGFEQKLLWFQSQLLNSLILICEDSSKQIDKQQTKNTLIWGPIPEFLSYKSIRQAGLKTTVITIILPVFLCALNIVCLLKRKHTTVHMMTLITYRGPIFTHQTLPAVSLNCLREWDSYLKDFNEKNLIRCRCTWMFVLLTNGWV